MRIASYNVENLFDRPKVLKNETWTAGRPVLAAFARVNELLQRDPYTEQDKAEILDALGQLKLLRADTSRLYYLRTPSGEPLVVLVNHLKSKGYGSASDPIGNRQRERQARRIAEIYRELVRRGHPNVAIVGDLNDDPQSDCLAPLLADTDLTDISEHPRFEWDHRLGTFKSGNLKDKIDYLLLSPPLFGLAFGGGIFRKGVYRGERTRDPWAVYPTLTAPVHEASDHAAIYADLEL